MTEETVKNSINDLKAHVYDLIMIAEKKQAEINQIRQQISQLTQQIAEKQVGK